MPTIHSTAVVSPSAHIEEGVEIGPFATVGPHVCLGEGTRVVSHAVIDGYTQIGKHCTVFPFASIGLQTQDLKYRGGRPGTVIGDHTTIREYVTVNAATDDGDKTVVGGHCHIMAYSHVAHDCRIGEGVIMANCATLGGHVQLEDYVIVGGLTGIHQFVKVGAMTILGGCSKLTQDCPPYMTADGNPLEVRGVNKIGMTRRGIDVAVQKSLKEAYRIIYRQGLTVKDAIAKIENEIPLGEEVKHLVLFLKNAERGIAR